MLSIFTPSGFALKKVDAVDLASLPESAVWVDLVKPSAQEDQAVERLAGIAVPTREDMQEIEISSRLYVENGARYMTATLMCHADTDNPKTTAVTMVIRSRLRSTDVPPDRPDPPPNMSDRPPPLPECSRTKTIRNSEAIRWTTMTAAFSTQE